MSTRRRTSSLSDYTDPLFPYGIWIDVAHHEVHEGDMFEASIYDEDAASGHISHIFILTPATAAPQKRMHLLLEYEGSGEHQFTITEGCTYSSGGAAYTPRNRFYGHANTTSAQSAYSGSDKGSNKIVVSGGSVIYDKWKGAGRSSGSQSRGLGERILAPNTGYLFALTSKAAGIQMDFDLVWYEHTDS